MENEARKGWYSSNGHLQTLMNSTVSDWILVPNDLQMECNNLFDFNKRNKRCTSGMLATLWTVKNCNHAVLFGFDEDPCYPYHYWNRAREDSPPTLLQLSPNCTEQTALSSPVYTHHPVHNFPFEHRHQIQMH